VLRSLRYRFHKAQSTKNKALGFMFLGKVVGTVWSTKKTPDLEGVRFLIVHPYDLDHEPTKNVVVVADRLGAGAGETVMCAFGKAARTAIGNQDMSIEAAVVGIVDRVDLTDSNSEELREAAHNLGRDNGRN
jgi:ethanolamine utilization protein EutN